MSKLREVSQKIYELKERKTEIKAVLKEFDKEGNGEPLITAFSLELENELNEIEEELAELNKEERFLTLEVKTEEFESHVHDLDRHNKKNHSELYFRIEELESKVRESEKRREDISMIFWYIILILPCVIVVGFIALRIFTFITK